MRPETKLWQSISPIIPGYITRIENSAGNGMPDVHVTFNGKDFWIELKIARACGTVLLRKEQRVWMFHRSRYGGKVWVLAKHGSYFYVFEKPWITEKYDDKYQRIISDPIVFEKLQQGIDWIFTS